MEGTVNKQGKSPFYRLQNYGSSHNTLPTEGPGRVQPATVTAWCVSSFRLKSDNKHLPPPSEDYCSEQVPGGQRPCFLQFNQNFYYLDNNKQLNTVTFLVNLHEKTKRWILLLLPIYRWRYWGTEKLINLVKVTPLGSERFELPISSYSFFF